MIIEDRLKFNGTVSGSVLTVTSAFAADCRTVAQAINDGANNPFAIKVGSQNVPFVMLDAGGNWQAALCTVTDPTHLTITRIVSSSNSGAAAAFSGAVVAFNTSIGESHQGIVDPNDVGFDIILLLGQSNMAGRGVIDANVDVSNSRVFQYGGDSTTAATYQKIALAQEPLSHAEAIGSAGTGVGPGLPFGRAYAAAQPSNRMILLVPCAMGSTGLVGGAWAPNAGANLSTQSVSQAQGALAAAQAIYPSSRIVGGLWAQGEADEGAGVSQATYASTLKSLFSYFRSALSAPSMWFVIHGMNPDYVTASGATWTAIQAALQQVAAQTDHCAYVDGPAGATYDNGVHYTSAGYRILGARSAAAAPAARRFLSVDVTPPTLAGATVSNGSPLVVVLSMSESLDTNYQPAASAFTVTGHTVNAVTVSGNSISLACSAAFVSGEAARTVAYTQPASGGARDLAGNLLASFSATTITNNVQPVDTTAPTFASAQVANGAPTVIAVTMSEALANVTPAASAFTVSGGKTVTGVSINGSVISLTCSAAYAYGDTITVQYVKPGSGNMLQDPSANLTASFGPLAVSNNVASASVTPTTWSATDKQSGLGFTDGSTHLAVAGTLGTASTWASIRSVASKSSGKFYFEVTPTAAGPILIGVDDGTTPLTDFVGADAGGWGYYNSPATYHSGGGVAGTTPVIYGANDTIGVAVDMDNRTIEWLKIASGSSTAVSIGKTANNTLPAKAMYAMVTTKDAGSPAPAFTANFGADVVNKPFKNAAPPTGFGNLS
jgi:hypothetical protein